MKLPQQRVYTVRPSLLGLEQKMILGTGTLELFNLLKNKGVIALLMEGLSTKSVKLELQKNIKKCRLPSVFLS